LSGHNSQCPLRRMFVHAERSFQLLEPTAADNVAAHFAANFNTEILYQSNKRSPPHPVKGIRTRKHRWRASKLELANHVHYVDATRASVACVGTCSFYYFFHLFFLFFFFLEMC
jgi:hypothetical protein